MNEDEEAIIAEIIALATQLDVAAALGGDDDEPEGDPE